MRNIFIQSTDKVSIQSMPALTDNRTLQPERLKGELTLAINDVVAQCESLDALRLLEKINQAYNKAPQLNPLQLTAIFHETAIMFIYWGEYEMARRVCNWHETLFNRLTIKHQQKTYLFHPLVNLLRIDYLQDNHERAAMRLQLLDDQLNFFETSGMFVDLELWRLRANNCYIEFIKHLLAAKKYPSLQQFFKSHPCEKPWPILFQESNAIMLANTKSFAAADAYLEICVQQAPRTSTKHFKLRACELRVVQAGKNALFCDTHFLYQAMFSILNEEVKNVRDLHFILHVAWMLEKANMIEEAIKLYYLLIESSEKLHVDYIKASSLTRLYHLIVEADGKIIIEDLMIELYSATQHGATQRFLHTAMPDLMHVERPSVARQARLMFAALSRLKKTL